MAIGIRKHPHPSQTRFYITKFTPAKHTVINLVPSRSSMARFARLVKSGKYDLFRCENHNVLLKVIIQ